MSVLSPEKKLRTNNLAATGLTDLQSSAKKFDRSRNSLGSVTEIHSPVPRAKALITDILSPIDMVRGAKTSLGI